MSFNNTKESKKTKMIIDNADVLKGIGFPSGELEIKLDIRINSNNAVGGLILIDSLLFRPTNKNKFINEDARDFEDEILNWVATNFSIEKLYKLAS